MSKASLNQIFFIIMLQVSLSTYLRFLFSLVLILVFDSWKSTFLLISCLFFFAFLVWSMHVKVSANTFSSLQPWCYRDRLLWIPSWVLRTETWDVQSLSFLSLYVSSKSLHFPSPLFTVCCTLPFSLSKTVYMLLLTAWLEKSKDENSSICSCDLMKEGKINFCHWKWIHM